MRRFTRALGTITLSLASGGCSFLFVDPAPRGHRSMLYFDCTSTVGPAVVDGVVGLAAGLTVVETLNTPADRYERENDGNDRDASAVVQGIAAAAFVGSAIYGVAMTEGCSDAKAALRQRIIERDLRRAREPSPVPPAPPPPPAPPATTSPPPEPAPAEALPPPEPPPAPPPPAAEPPAAPGAPVF